jgi:glycosyltransferase involved in cell wall biosynthesis
MFTSPFQAEVTVPRDCKVVWVQDMFAEQYAGGAELTSQALIDDCPEGVDIFRINSDRVTMGTLQSAADKLWVFGNFGAINASLVPTIVANIRYVILEYDYKFCLHRSIELHEKIEGSPCDCDKRDIGKLVSAFFYGARHIFWMSAAQRDRYLSRFPFIAQRPSTVLSSVFSSKTLAEIVNLRETAVDRSGWIVLGSTSWIKGAPDAEQWCKDEQKEYEVVWNVPYFDLLKRLSRAEGFVYLPKGGDTCPRMVIEAKLLGCKIHTNGDVQHAAEPWFDTNDLDSIEIYLSERPATFWSILHKEMPGNQRISGYTTTYNCISGGYPFRESITSLLGFCDEVVVVDAGSTDGTLDALRQMQVNDERLVLHVQERDWSHPRSAVFDGQQKALARAICTGDFCWQQDSDEIVHEQDYQKIRDMVSSFPTNIDLIALPVVEFWGSTDKVRIDVNPWKWRLSRNVPYVTHGIPGHLRRFDEEGRLYSSVGSDGCDYIRSDSFEPVNFANFMTQDSERVRQAALAGSPEALQSFEAWFSKLLEVLPSVRHYSWWDMRRKIKSYRTFWQRHWESLFNVKREDTAENNMFFDKPWSQVTDQEIDELADRLQRDMGGWVFHSRIDFNRKTPHISVLFTHPVVIEKWKTGGAE